MNRTKPIDGELLKIKEEIILHAQDYGLDFYPVIFEMCDYDTINILAAQGGFPQRYPHWRFGMDYDQMSKGYRFGLQKIYEMVINTRPVYAYLLNVNHLVDQKTVMAHVYGHADFFKNNAYFANTNRNMMDVMANHGTKIRRYMEKYGQDKVENFIDKVSSLENLLDPALLFNPDSHHTPSSTPGDSESGGMEVNEFEAETSVALSSFMRTKRRMEESQIKPEHAPDEIEKMLESKQLPTRDMMKFLALYAPVEEWQSDIIGILREEAYYFLPQRLTKIMNEGWASYWHSTIMTQKALRASEIVDFADHHAGVMSMGRKNINPYKIGIELFRDIEHRWDTGKFGKDYHDCDDMVVKSRWNRQLNLGRKKIFEVRKTHSDITFIDEFFTPEFCERQQLFTYKFNPRTGRNELENRDFQEIKSKLLAQLTNFGTPLITIESANDQNRGELLLHHHHQGVDLDLQMAAETMRNVHAIWKRPVNLVTTVENKSHRYTFNGREFRS